MMAVPDPFLSLHYPSNVSLVWLKQQLTAADLRVVQTFDLTTARHALGDCSCPHHGTEQCDCQMVVLLVYANGAEPTTLILHGNDGQSWLSLVEHPGQQPDKETIKVIQRALQGSAAA
ncbi:MAG TPA: hypothetical protein VKP08_09360 [Anaerolineales bacterium]|nr:hypothetical protein [Anaerolineales bacterium]